MKQIERADAVTYSLCETGSQFRVSLAANLEETFSSNRRLATKIIGGSKAGRKISVSRAMVASENPGMDGKTETTLKTMAAETTKATASTSTTAAGRLRKLPENLPLLADLNCDFTRTSLILRTFAGFIESAPRLPPSGPPSQ